MRKHWLALCVALCLLFGGCARAIPTQTDTLKVICTVFPPYDFVRVLAGEAAEVSLLLNPGQECHTYEPTPKDILEIEQCDLFVYVGGESEAWVTDILDSMDSPPRTLRMMDCVEPLLHQHEHDEHEHEHDEHVWTSPVNAQAVVGELCNVLCLLSPQNATVFQTAMHNYINDLAVLDRAFAVVAAQADKSLVFADRFPFSYFTQHYALAHHSAYYGCAHNAQVSAATVADLVDIIRQEDIPVVLYIEFSNGQIARTLQEETGAQPRLFHSCHNVTRDELNNGATYLSLMEHNLTVLKEALSL